MSSKTKSDSDEKLTGKRYLKELRKLQVELCRLQAWVKHTGKRADRKSVV